MNDLNIWVQEEAGIGELMGVGGDTSYKEETSGRETGF